MLKPTGMKGEALLDHVIQFRKRNDERDFRAKSSEHLVIDMSKAQERVLNPSLTD